MLKGERVAPEPQLLLHRFRLDRLLGRGGAGEVHAACDLLTERSVALKLLRPDAVDLDLEESLRAEFRTLRALTHPGIVQVFDFGRAGGSPFYTMELLEGADLAQARGAVDPHALVEQVAPALDYLHASGLVHSDLKPSNVFLVGERFKLTDFGLVRRTQGPRREAPYGTLAYMPPERLRAGEGAPDPREDLYAFGAILFEVLVGRPPYAAPTADETVARILAGDVDAECAAVPEPWTRIVRRLLAPDPQARFASAWDLLQTWSAQFDRPQPAPPLWAAPFVGRRRELALVRAALAEAARGKGAVFHVAGLPGVGKSAFLEAAAAQVASHGLPCWRVDAPASPRPLELLEALATLYRRWSPGLPEDLRPASERLAAWPEAVREAMDEEGLLNVHAHALADVRAVAAVVPHVLVIDDAHRLDHGSRALLRFLAASARDLGVVVLVGARTGADGDEADVLGRDIHQARQAGGPVQTLVLRELAPEDVAALVRRRFGASQEFELLARRIFDLTLGHPFFVSEALQHLLLTGQLRRQAQGWQIQPQTERKLLPRMADTILAEHVGAAREADRAVFEVLALFPAGAVPAIVGRVLDRDEGDVRDALERGVRIGLLSAARDGFRFGHELLREASAARLPAAVARRFHRQIADALAGTPAEAHHRLAAGETSPQARECYLREARSYEERRAPWEALRFFEAALGADPSAPDGEELALRVAELMLQVGQSERAAGLLLQRLVAVRRPLLRARYLHRLGDAYGRQGRNNEALFHMQAASELLRTHAGADEQRRFAADLARILLAKGDRAAAIEECTRARATLGPGEDPRMRAALLLLQAQAERQSGDYGAAETTCREALEALKPLGRTLEMAQTYTQIGNNYAYRRDWDQAERFFRAALKVHSELGDLQGMKSAYNNLGSALMRADKLEESTVAHEQSLEIKRRLGDRPGEGSSLNNLGNLWERRGDHRRAFQCYRRGVSLYRRLNRPRELATLYNNMGEVHVRLGRFRNARRLLLRAERQAAALPGAYIAQVVALNLGRTELSMLDPQSAIATCNDALQQVRRSGLTALAAQFHAQLALAYAHADDAEQAALHERQALEAVSPELEEEARVDVLLDLAEAACHRGRTVDAEASAREAREVAERTGRPHGRARALRLLAVCDQRRGEWDLAEAQLEEALGLARSLGFRYEQAKCYKSLGHLHREIGLRARAEEDLQHCVQLLAELGLRAEVGLTYLELARLASGSGPGT